MKFDLLQIINQHETYLKNTRGYLHQYPELAAEEFKTTAFLQEEVAKLNLPITKIEGTGFVALLDTGKPGKSVALRTDIDALPMEESVKNLIKQKEFISVNKGVSHTCGHDAHMAMQLTAIKVLHEIKDNLSGKIYFLFEEGEEKGTGINQMLDYISTLNLDAIYGTHVASFIESGKICVDEGPRMAGSVYVDFDVIGKSGHGSRPDLSINPIFATAQVLSAISVAWNNQLNVEETVTLGLTQIQGGTTYNIIPDVCNVKGSLRYFNKETAYEAIDILKSVIENTAKAHKCDSDTSKIKIMTIPVINDTNLATIAKNGIDQILPGHLIYNVKWYASESFSYYSKVAPTCFAFLGIKNENLGSGAEHHNICFDIDDDALKYGVVASTKFVLDFLNS